MIILYATDNNGDGRVQQVGKYEDWSDIEVHVGMFKEDVIITFEVEHENDNS